MNVVIYKGLLIFLFLKISGHDIHEFSGKVTTTAI
jgi:hypothetical protein